jgi:putative ABC transport system permease protein
MIKHPPRFSNLVLRIFLRREEFLERSGDLEEIYSHLVAVAGPFRAGIWFRFQVLKVTPVCVMNSICWRLVMFRNYIKVAWRSIMRHKGYSLVNLSGLMIGFTCFILIGLFVRYELSYDRFHQNADRIFRVVTRIEYANGAGTENIWNCTPMPLKSAMENDLPEVLSATRVDSVSGVVRHGDQIHFEQNLFLADPEFFRIFSFPLLSGDPETALNEPSSVVLTQESARKYFGHKDPMGKIMQIDDREYAVTGVARRTPGNSHFRFDFLMPYSSVLATSSGRAHWNNWDSIHGPTYVLLEKGADPGELEAKLPAFFKKHAGEESNYHLLIEPMTSIHLRGKLMGELDANGDVRYVAIFSAAAVFILLIACFNHVNLSTARGGERAKEVGIRKVAGADRRKLIHQFFLESMLFTCAASALAIPCALLLVPALSAMVGRELSFNLLMTRGSSAIFVALVLFVGFLSGGYPSLYLSSFQPVKVIKGVRMERGRSRFLLRNGLVVGQFVMSTVLIICTLVVARQLDYIGHKRLGFDKEYVVAVPIRDHEMRRNLDAFKSALRQRASVSAVSYQDRLPSEIRHVGSFFVEGQAAGEEVKTYVTFVDHEYAGFYNMKIVAGRDFSRGMTTDPDQAALVNERAVKELGFDDPIGKRVRVWGRDLTIVGVVEDFHFLPLRQSIAPLTISLSKPSFLSDYGLRYGFLAVKISSQEIPRTLSLIEQEFKKYSPNSAFEYAFLDDRIGRMYVTDRQSSRSFLCFSAIAILIACFGLFGLAAFSAGQRTKEIGVRKVLGASVSGLFYLVSRDLTKWVLMANVVAWPTAYWVMKGWLQNFAYRVDLGIWMFALSAALTYVVALVTVGYQSLKAARANPMDCLRYE